jgi:uncharacterized protein (UPF0332 family)
MSIDRMVGEGRIHTFQATPEEIARVMGIARRDLAGAEKIIDQSLDLSYSIAYNAVLQACRAYMFHRGYRAASAEVHKATFEFMQLAADEPMRTTIDYFDRVRKKRHRVMYDEVGLVTEKEAQQLVAKAKEFVELVERLLKQTEA